MAIRAHFQARAPSRFDFRVQVISRNALASGPDSGLTLNGTHFASTVAGTLRVPSAFLPVSQGLRHLESACYFLK